MRFRKWMEIRERGAGLMEVGMGGGGPGSGMSPPLQSPDLAAMQDYQGEEQRDPKMKDGKLPPVKRRRRAGEQGRAGDFAP